MSLIDAQFECNKAMEKYEQKYGKDSLDRTPYLYDPVHPTEKDYLRAAKIYNWMVKRGYKFKSAPKGVWDELIF